MLDSKRERQKRDIGNSGPASHLSIWSGIQEVRPGYQMVWGSGPHRRTQTPQDKISRGPGERPRMVAKCFLKVWNTKCQLQRRESSSNEVNAVWNFCCLRVHNEAQILSVFARCRGARWSPGFPVCLLRCFPCGFSFLCLNPCKYLL